MGWSERFRARNFTAFSYTLKALGSGIAYLTLWASLNIYHLFPAWLAFCLMVAVTATNALFALKQESELLAGYALLGGLVTPALLSTAEDNGFYLRISPRPGSWSCTSFRAPILAAANNSGICRHQHLFLFVVCALLSTRSATDDAHLYLAIFRSIFCHAVSRPRQARSALGLNVVRRFVVAAPVAVSAVAAFEAFPLDRSPAANGSARGLRWHSQSVRYYFRSLLHGACSTVLVATLPPRTKQLQRSFWRWRLDLQA